MCMHIKYEKHWSSEYFELQKVDCGKEAQNK